MSDGTVKMSDTVITFILGLVLGAFMSSACWDLGAVIPRDKFMIENGLQWSADQKAYIVKPKLEWRRDER